MADKAHFQAKVHELIPDNEACDRLFESLRRYQSSQKLHQLLLELRQLLDEPDKLELYEFIRPLILLRHQMEYSYLAPAVPGVRLRTVRLRRSPGQSLGFAVRGGYEFSVGVFVSAVEPGSQAEKQGLKVGDEIVRVNGFTIAEAIHDDVLNLIKSRDEIVLKVTHIGMLPVKDHASDAVTWRYVEDMDSKAALEEVLAEKREKGGRGVELKIFIDCTGYDSIGCGILSGPRHYPGIFVEKVRPGSLAEEVGLEVGDQIVEVNESSFLNIGHKEAVVVLKGSKQLNVIVRKHSGLPLFERRQTPARASASSSSSKSSQAPSAQSMPPTSQRWPPSSEGSGFSSGLDEGQLIEQQLSRTSLSRWGADRSSQDASDQRGGQAYISTQAQVHSDSDSYPPASIGSMPRIPVEEHAPDDASTFLSSTTPLELPSLLLPDLGSPNDNTPSFLPPLTNLELPDSPGHPGDLPFSCSSPTSSSSSLAGNPAYSDSCSPPASPVSSFLLPLPDDLGDPVLAVLHRSAYPPDLPPWILPHAHCEAADPKTVHTVSTVTPLQGSNINNPDLHKNSVHGYGFGNSVLGKSPGMYCVNTKSFFSVYSHRQHAASDLGTNHSFTFPPRGGEGGALTDEVMPVTGSSGGALMARYLREGRGDHNFQAGLHPLAEEDENEDKAQAEQDPSFTGLGAKTDSEERRSYPPVFVPPPPPTSTPPPTSPPPSITVSPSPPPPPPLFQFDHSESSAFRMLPLSRLSAASAQTQDAASNEGPREEKFFSKVTPVEKQPGEGVSLSTANVMREIAVEDLVGESFSRSVGTVTSEIGAEDLPGVSLSLSASTVRKEKTEEEINEKSWSRPASKVTEETTCTVEDLLENMSDMGSSKLDHVTSVVGGTILADADACNDLEIETGDVVHIRSGAAAPEPTHHPFMNGADASGEGAGIFVEQSLVHSELEAACPASRMEIRDALPKSLAQASGSSSPNIFNHKADWGEKDDGQFDSDDRASGSVEGVSLEVSVDVHQSPVPVDFTVKPTADSEKHEDEGPGVDIVSLDISETAAIPSSDFPPPPPSFWMDIDDDSKMMADSEILKSVYASTHPSSPPAPEALRPSSFLPKSLLIPELNTAPLPLPSPALPTTPLVLGGAPAVIVARQEDQEEEPSAHLLGPASADVLSSKHVTHAQLAVWFNPLELDGRELKAFVFSKSHTLGVEMEGGMGTPLAGRIVVAAVFDGGAAMEQGLQTGDQLMMINGQKLTDVTVAQAEDILEEAYNGSKDQIQVVYVQSSFLNDEECVTYF